MTKIQIIQTYRDELAAQLVELNRRTASRSTTAEDRHRLPLIKGGITALNTIISRIANDHQAEQATRPTLDQAAQIMRAVDAIEDTGDHDEISEQPELHDSANEVGRRD